MLMSDLHLGAAATDENKIRRELKKAVDIDARILINGDLFDGILPKDMKRFTPSAVKSELQGKDALINRTVEYVANFLEPYKTHIDMIGVGNHETAILKHHSVDLVDLLLKQLDCENIKFGGYTGFVVYRYSYNSNDSSRTRTVCIFYNHGKGGSAPVTKGTIDFQRNSALVEGADIIWLGHNHQRNSVINVKVGYDRSGNVRFRNEHCVRTGSYMRFTEEMYAVNMGLSPLPHGGALATININYDNTIKIEITQ